MKMKVVDQLHVSSVSPHAMGKGQEFEVSDAIGTDLEKRGLATRVEGEEAIVAAKAEEAPPNKAERAAPANKAITGRKAKSKA